MGSNKKQDQDIVIEKSKRLIGLDEFVKSKELRPEEIAGFKAYTRKHKYLSRENWNLKLLEYKNRDLKEG
jgi:hypothetical protein